MTPKCCSSVSLVFFEFPRKDAPDTLLGKSVIQTEDRDVGHNDTCCFLK